MAAVVLAVAGAWAYSRTTATTGPASCTYDPDAPRLIPGDDDGLGDCDGSIAFRYVCLDGRIMWLDTDNSRYGYEGDDWLPVPARGVLPGRVLDNCTRWR